MSVSINLHVRQENDYTCGGYVTKSKEYGDIYAVFKLQSAENEVVAYLTEEQLQATITRLQAIKRQFKKVL